MRIATLILGTGLGLFLAVVAFIAQVADYTALERDGATGWSATTFWFLPLIYLVAVAFVMAFPLVSATAFLGALALSLSAAFSVETASTYGGVQLLWSIASLVLMGLSIGGYFERRRQRRQATGQMVVQRQ